MLSDKSKTIATVLDLAADKIEPKEAWVQRAFAINAFGKPTDGYDPNATCWCAYGALQSVAYHGFLLDDAARVLTSIVGCIPDWNDAPERTQPEVVAALRNAATLARAGAA